MTDEVAPDENEATTATTAATSIVCDPNTKAHPSLPLNEVTEWNKHLELWDTAGHAEDWNHGEEPEWCDSDSDDESVVEENDHTPGLDGVSEMTMNLAPTAPLATSTTKMRAEPKTANTIKTEDLLPTPLENATSPNCCVAESHLPKHKVRIADHRLHLPSGNRKLRDCSILSKMFKNCAVSEHGELPLSVGDMVNKKKGRCGKQSQLPTQAGNTICADIECGDGVSPGGHRHCLVMVDKATQQSWIDGLQDLHGNTLAVALCDFAEDSGRFPCCLQCDFDTKFLGRRFRQVFK